jgi:hypothetical protein
MQNNNIIKKLSFFCLASIVLYACSHKESKVTYSFTQDTLNVSRNLQIEGFYEDKSGIYFYGKTFDKDSVFLYNENNGQFIFHSFLKLPSTYLDTLKNKYEPIDLAFITLDSLIAFTSQSIALLDVKNDSMLRYFLHSQDGDTCYLVNRGCKLKWNAARKALPIMIIRTNDMSNRKWNWDSEFLGEFSIETGKVKILPLKFPYVEEYYGTKNYYSFCDPMITFKGEKYVVGFKNTPVTFIYDASKNKMDSLFIVNSNYKPLSEVDTVGLTSPSNYINFIIAGSTYEFYFEHLIYDGYKDVFYRFFLKEMPKKNKEGLLNTLKEKPSGVTLLDKNLNVIGDTYWIRKRTNNWFPSSKGLLGITYSEDKVIIIKLLLEYEK